MLHNILQSLQLSTAKILFKKKKIRQLYLDQSYLIIKRKKKIPCVKVGNWQQLIRFIRFLERQQRLFLIIATKIANIMEGKDRHLNTMIGGRNCKIIIKAQDHFSSIQNRSLGSKIPYIQVRTFLLTKRLTRQTTLFITMDQTEIQPIEKFQQN